MKLITYKTKTLFITLLLALGCLSPIVTMGSSVSAADLFGGAKKEACAGVELKEGDGNDCTKDDAKTVSDIINDVIDLLSIVVGIICVIVIIISGFRYITAGGDSNNLTSARNTFIYALVGLIIVAFAQIIVKFVIGRISG